MKIAVICPYSLRFAGGVQHQVLQELQFLADNGVDCTLIAPDVDAAPEWVNAEPHIQIVRMGGAVRIRGNGSKVPLSFPLFSLWRLGRIVADHDVIHFHEPFYPFTYLLARRSKQPMIATFHANRPKHPFYQYLRQLFQPVFTRFALRIAVSEAARLTLSRHFQGAIEIIPNGIAMGKLTRGKKSGILFIGRNEPRKGFDILLEAMQLVWREEPEMVLHVCGMPERKDQNHLIQHHGIVTDAEKKELLDHVALLCAPSIGGESFGVVLLEAMAAETAVIASDIEGYRSVVQQEKTGLLFAAKNTEALAQAILRLHRDKPLRDALVKNGRRHAEAYGWDTIGKTYLAHFERLSNVA